MGYELPPVVVTSGELEGRLAPMYEKLHIAPGQVEALTGISERRWWGRGHSCFPDGRGVRQPRSASWAKSGMRGRTDGVLVYCGVCRENFLSLRRPAVRWRRKVGVAANAFVYDISNACLGVMNGIIDLANRIELGQIKAGMVVSCESAGGKSTK